MSDDPAKNWLVSWWCPPHLMGKFELHSPWWISGERLSDGAQSICAAIQAANEGRAKATVWIAHDDPPEDYDEIEWRFVSERPDDWVPFNDRFPQADWMKWRPLSEVE